MIQRASFDQTEICLTTASPITSIDWGYVKAVTIILTISEDCGGELLAIRNREGRHAIRLYSDISQGMDLPSLVFELFTDARDQPLVLSVPGQIFRISRYEIIVRYNSFILELFLDGVLLDEEWPMGTVDLRDMTVQISSGVTQARMIRYALSETEMAAIFGDEESIRERKKSYLGTEPSSIQYWRPRGWNTGVGDCMPYYDGTLFHIFYLFDRRGHRSKWGLGAHQWAHISAENLKDWVEHPLAVGITHEWEGSICTGSVFREDNQFYAYYAVRAVDGSPARLTWATSSDGIHFEKSGRSISLSENYHLASVRDPVVFKDHDGLYHMLVTTSIMTGEQPEGCLAHLISNDLINWEEQSPFIVPGYHDQPECSDYFEWNGWYYLIFSNDGIARYRYSRNPFGPWLRPSADVMDGPQLRVPKSAAYKDGRRLLVGFLAEREKYGGELVIRELIQHPDGTLGLKFVDELVDRTGPVIRLQSVEGNEAGRSISLDNMEGLSDYRFNRMEQEYLLTFEVVPHYPNMYFGFSIADSADFQRGYDIRFEPAASKVGIHPIYAPSYVENEVSSLYNVEGLDQRVVVEAIVTGGLVDLCVNGKRTILSRMNKRFDYLRFFVQFGNASFHNITIYSLSGCDSGGSGYGEQRHF